MTNHYKTEHSESWQVPQHDEMPSEEMIEWLGKCTQDWSGDESGINIEDHVAGPGDWVACAMGHYFVVEQKVFNKYMGIA